MRDDIIIAFAKLRAHGHDAEALLLAAAAQLPARQRAAYRREVTAVVRLYAEVCPAPAPVQDRPPPEERKTKVTRRERASLRRYMSDYKERLSAHARAR